MTRKYYACTLKGGEVLGIDEVFVFNDFSMRKQWVSERGNSITLNSKIAKKHKVIEVDFGVHYLSDNSRVWTWFYDGFSLGE
jgi:hypothetical protein